MSGPQAGAREEYSFRELIDPAFDDLWRFVRRRCRSAADADDVVAEVLAVAWRRRVEVPTGDGTRPWLLATARRVLANHHRGARRRSALAARAVTDAPTRPGVPDPAAVAVDHLEPDRGLAHALHGLDPEERELLLMRAWDGLAVTEMAAVLGLTPNAVSIRLSRARGRLARLLESSGQPTETASAGHVRLQDPTTPEGGHR